MQSLYQAMLPPRAIEPLCALSTLGDTEAPEASLSWGELAKQEEWEEAACVAAPTSAPPVSLTPGQELLNLLPAPLTTDWHCRI